MRRTRSIAAWMLPGLLLLISACGTVPGSTRVFQPAVAGLRTALHDEVQDLPAGRIAWSTFWELCWDAYPQATAYELEVQTSEGTSPRLKRQPGTCYRVETAAGENARAEGLAGRDMQLLIQGGQLGYRVRAVLGNQAVSEWSPAIAVGE